MSTSDPFAQLMKKILKSFGFLVFILYARHCLKIEISMIFMKDIFLRILITWLLFLPVPVINGILREKWYKSLVGETAAHQIGTLVVSLFFVLYAYVSLKDKIHGLSNTQLLFVG